MDAFHLNKILAKLSDLTPRINKLYLCLFQLLRPALEFNTKHRLCVSTENIARRSDKAKSSGTAVYGLHGKQIA